MTQERRVYDKEFKEEAVLLSNEAGRTAADVAASLGISVQTLYSWRRDYKKHGSLAFPGHGNEALTEEQKRIRALERQLKDVTMERDILKKAVGIFSKAPK